jgi:N utilization substance protein B
MGTGTRRRAREAALKILFQMDLAGTPAEDAIAAYWDSFDLEAEGDAYAGVLVRGIAERLADVDDAIRKASTRWRIDRMALVDRNVLRIGAYELLYLADVPTRVILDEAIELGKRFGSEESGAFVNGVLDRLAHVVRDEGGPVEGGA